MLVPLKFNYLTFIETYFLCYLRKNNNSIVLYKIMGKRIQNANLKNIFIHFYAFETLCNNVTFKHLIKISFSVCQETNFRILLPLSRDCIWLTAINEDLTFRLSVLRLV